MTAPTGSRLGDYTGIVSPLQAIQDNFFKLGKDYTAKRTTRCVGMSMTDKRQPFSGLPLRFVSELMLGRAHSHGMPCSVLMELAL